jgi:hypothetical protein
MQVERLDARFARWLLLRLGQQLQADSWEGRSLLHPQLVPPRLPWQQIDPIGGHVDCESDVASRKIEDGRREDSAPALCLTDRDLRLMALLYDVNFLSTSQLVLLGWGERGERAGQARLKRLHDGGYVDRFRPVSERGSAEWNYRLSSDLPVDSRAMRRTSAASWRSCSA